MLIDIACHNAALIFHQSRHMGGLAARSTATVDNEFTRLRVNDMRNQHGTFVLHLTQAFLQGGKIIQGTMRRNQYAFRCPLAFLHFRASFFEGLHEFCSLGFQRIGAHR